MGESVEGNDAQVEKVGERGEREKEKKVSLLGCSQVPSACPLLISILLPTTNKGLYANQCKLFFPFLVTPPIFKSDVAGFPLCFWGNQADGIYAPEVIFPAVRTART